MIQQLINVVLALIEALRRLWQRVIGRSPRPVPVPVRAQRFASPLSHTLADPRTRTVGIRRGREW